MKKILIISFFVLIAVLSARGAAAKETVEIFYFYENGCPSCQAMTDTLHQLEQTYGIILAPFDVTTDTSNRTIFFDLLTLYQLPSRQTPTVFIGSTVFIGYSADIVNDIRNTIVECQTNRCDSPREALDQYYDLLAHPESENGLLQNNRALFWVIFMIIWPLFGAVAIYIVIKKYRRK